MDELQKLYDLLVREGKYTKSFDEFKTKWSGEEGYQDKVFDVVSRDGFYTKDKESFITKYGAPELKKKEAFGPLPAEGVPSFTEFPSEVGPSVSPEPTKPKSTKPTEELAVGPMGITGLQRTAEYEAPKEFEDKGVSYILGDLLKTAGKGVFKFPADVLETAAIGTAAIKNSIAKTGTVEETEASKLAIYKSAQEYKKLLEDVIPTDKDISSGFWGQTASALGEMVPIILSGLTLGGAKAVAYTAAKNGTKLQSVINYGKNLASRMATPQGGLVISQVAAPSYEQAKADGATENQALAYAIQNALVSYPIEMLPINGLFKRLDKVLVDNRGVEVLKRAFIGGSEEAITEGFQNVYENVSANQIYGTTKEILDGVGNASAVGGTVGVIVNGLLTALLGKRARATTTEEKEQLDKSIEEVRGKVEQVNSNNEKLIETINVLEQSKPRTLAYGSAEYNFIESPDGNLELAEDDMTKEQAQGVINNLSTTYKKINFLIEEIEPEDPYKPTTYKVIGEPIKTEQDAIQKQAAGEVPVQPRAGVSETLEEGKPQAEPEGVTAEGVTEEVVKEKIKPIDFSNQIEQKYGVQVDLLGNLDKGDLTLSRIIVPEEQRGTGIGTDVMNEIVKYADDNNKRITLTPSTDFGGESVERLTDFYKQFGFIENKGENKDFTIKDTMYRSPEVSLKTQPEAALVIEAAPEVMIDELLTADTKDATVLEKVRNFLDKAEADLDKFGRETTGINLAIPVVKVIIKTVKALVNTGITLQEAIRRAAAENNVSEEDVINSIKSFSEQRALEIKPEIELPGYNRMIEELQGVVEKSKQRGVDEEGTMNNAMSYLQGSKVYEDASDTQREQMVRDVRTMFAAKEKAAPSVRRLFGEIKDVAKVTMTEKSALVKQIKDLAKGARDAKKAIAGATQSMAKEINDLSKRGIISLNQASNIISKFSKVNPLSSSSVSKFVDYTTKVFADAEYASKLNNAKGLRKDIKKLSKDKDRNANLRDLGTELSKIEPSMVDDINAYNDMASKIKEAIKGSTIRGQKVSIADTVNINSALEYTKKSLDAQDKLMREEKAAEIQDLMGIDVSELSYDDMMALLESKEPITKYNEDIIRSTINKVFGVFSSVINETINTGKDPFTGEDVEFTESQKDLIKRFMGMDLNILKPREALQAVDALANFIQNKSTAKMETVVRSYTGSNNARQLAKEGVRAYRLQKYWSPALGRFLGEQITNLPTLIEKMFKGFNAGGRVMDMMGLTELINNKASAQTESNKIIDKYVKQFYDKKPNGEAFNTEYNNAERGMAAFMMRNIIGTEAEMNKEFERRKNLLLKVDKDGNKTGSIAELEKGDEKERAKAELYQRAYDKIFSTEITPEAPAKVLRAEPKNAKDIAERIDPVNLQAINFWKNEWSDRYDRLSDVSQNIYNKILEKDINFIPDRFARLSSDTGIVELSNDDSAFHSNNGTLYQKETGSLMKATRPESLPVNAETNETNRYVDLSFDAVNANAMYDALMDINTAAPIKQIQGFLNSPDFKKIFPNTEDAKIIKGDKDRIGRVDLYIRNFRRKNPYSSDEMSNAIKNLNRIASIGVGQALGGISQPLKQVIPVAMNTLINAGSLDLSATFNKDKNDFISNSGYAIANRGVESQAQIESINKLLDTASKSKGEKTLKAIEEANQLWLKAFLVKPDVFIARASWLTYYEQYLKDNGIDTKNIDYKNHELNKNAANYAQRMVDRQQNVSDADLSGKLLTSKDPTTQFLMKTLMPLSSFRMAQSSRLGADLATLMNKTSTAEDKKIASKSVSGYGVELVTFRMMQILSTLILGTIAKKLMDREEDEEQKKKRVDNVIKGARTGTFTDIVSPLPIMDKVFQEGGNILLDQIEKTSGLPVSIFGTKKEDFFQNLGLFGIPLQRADQLWELSKLTTTGNYTDDFGRQKTISDKSQDELRKLAPFAIMSNIGLAPSEFNTVIRYAISDAKKKPSATAEEREAKMERKEEREENLEQKLDALEELRKKTRNKNIIEAIDEKIDELEATDEEKKIIKEENKEERELKKELLTDPNTGIEYDNESELKRYNKRLWNKNFGPRSEWFKEHKYEKEAEKLMNKEIRKQEDKEQRYIGPIKKRNSDGSLKRTYGKKTR